MKFPKITIITPSFNQGQYIEETILSIINQDYPNLEFIIIDGESTDETVSIIKKYESHIDYWVSEPDQGTWDANNKGLEQMTGDYWCVVNSDDILMPGALRHIARTIEEYPEVKWVSGGYRIIDAGSNLVNEKQPQVPEKLEGFSFLQGCWIAHCSTYLHRSVIHNIGTFRNWHIMDYDYWLRMEVKHYSPLLIPEVLSAFRMHETSKTSQKISLHEEIQGLISTFCKENNIPVTQALKQKNRERDIKSLQLALSQGYTTGTQLMSYLFRYPDIITERWFWGGLKKALSETSI